MRTSILSSVVIVVLSLATGASARPCKALFYISATTTTAYYPYNSLPRNAGTFVVNRGPRHLTLIFSSTATRLPGASDLNPDFDGGSRLGKMPDFPRNLYSSFSSSIRTRSLDIMGVFGALLFGIGCGGIAAAIIYLLWAFFSIGRFELQVVSSSSDDDEDDHVGKRLGYVVIPNQPAVVDDDLKKPAPVPENL